MRKKIFSTCSPDLVYTSQKHFVIFNHQFTQVRFPAQMLPKSQFPIQSLSQIPFPVPQIPMHLKSGLNENNKPNMATLIDEMYLLSTVTVQTAS